MLRYAFTIFVSAFLLFQVQPLIGRFILPWFGGGPSIWTTCMLFFQLLLLGGYLYSHLLSTKLSVRSQVITHLAMLALSLLFLPIIPSDAWKPVAGKSPALQILLLLLATVGGPYFMLASTGPLMQRWFSHTDPGKSAYRLYALSNVGSLLALLSYPFVFEPWMQLRQQATNWTSAYVVYVLLAGWCAVRLWHELKNQPESVDKAPIVESAGPPEPGARAPGWFQMLLWLGLSSCGSAMLLATTNQLCIDVATVPFLWVLPLSIYLLTFILCFDNPRWYDRRIFGALLVLAVPTACWILYKDADAAISDQIVVYSVVLFACCMACHGELVQCRPHIQYLTLFYVLVSAGGALGGLFVAIVATSYFKGYWEYEIGLGACCVFTMLAWCYNRVWLAKPVPAFWIWLTAATVQIGAIEYFLYGPMANSLSSQDRHTVFGIYALIQFVGLVLTAAFERSQRLVIWSWTTLGILQFAWLGCYIKSHYPALMTPRDYIEIALGTVIPAIIGIALFWFVSRRNSQSKAAIVRLLLVVAVAFGLWALWYFEHLESWKILAMGGACASGLLFEWAITQLRAPGRDSWGMWFWIPGATVCALFCMQLVDVVKDDDYDIVQLSRNFYGVLRVRYEDVEGFGEGDTSGKYSLTHGQILHGFQFTDDFWKRQPTTYYGRESGIGMAFRICHALASSTDQHPLRVGVVGLGTGSIAVYGKAGDKFRFYEINPDVKALTGKFFTYLTDTPAETEVVMGDARISMERELAANESQQFDLLAIDAFSSDAIPVHLLTTECGEIYRRQIRPGGILAVHISNRFLDLNPISRGLADHLGWRAFRIENDEDDSVAVFSSTWILLTSSDIIAKDDELLQATTPWDESDQIIQWTDDYSGLWRILSF